ncbi:MULTISPECIES: hypothetical protein [Acinetobacter]|uniref:hypothetical protein n=1 Tax=Acinetobacter TaxID=469 RepID=UPI0014369F9A|nr:MULTISPECIES: hypothetical protein [Acinetobacter]MCA4814592.1 hypothetical protein [Acinetobacter towneri]QIV93382.1 hypothetical protein GVU25_11635 [Acinetobacter towneri]UNT61679.1 hypothetical protein IHE36_12360 [Acinetobacter towneri]
MTALRTHWQKIQQSIWLLGAVLCLLAALIFWAVTDREELVEIEKQPESEIELQIQPEKVAATTYLGGLQEEVRPLELTTRLTASGLHEAEFRGTKFIQEQKNNSTIELFRVNDENIIKSFIKKQTDRSKLFYIRLSGEGQAEQYVMLYGSFGNKRDAAQTLTALPFKFPETIQPVVVQFADYRPYVNDLGADEMGLSTKLYAVNLRPAAVPKIDESVLARPPATTTTAPTTQAVAPQNSTTSTTITRRDQEGNVVDVQKSQSGTAPVQPDAPEPEVRDPFN